jgi:uncharacterized membrane protein YgcG
MSETAEQIAARLAKEAVEALDRELTAQEAANKDLHAQAIGVHNIKILIPVTLDKSASNYHRWRTMFLVVLGKYNLQDHVLTDVAHPTRAAWKTMDCCIVTWIYCTTSNDLQHSLMLRSPAARAAWLYLQDEFLGQRESRTLLLEAEFRTFKQGDLNVTDYCRRLETMAASLSDFGDPIDDRQLVLTLLRGLNGKFKHMVSNLKMQWSFPTFVEARTSLLLEEIDVHDIEIHSDGTPASTAGTQALVAAHQPPCPQSGSGSGSSGSTSNSGGRNRRRGRGGNGDQTGHGGQTGGQSGGQAHSKAPGGPRPGVHAAPPGYFNPWSGTVQLWPHGYGDPSGHSMLRHPFQPIAQPLPALHMMPYQGGSYQQPPPGFGYVGGAPPPTPTAGVSSSSESLYGSWNPMTGASPSTRRPSSTTSTR